MASGSPCLLYLAQACAWDFLVKKRGLAVGSPRHCHPREKGVPWGLRSALESFLGLLWGKEPEAPSLREALPQGPLETTGWVVGPQVQVRRPWRAPVRDVV